MPGGVSPSGGGGGGGAGGVVSGSVNTVKGEHRVVVGAGGGIRSNGEPSSIVGPAICWTATGGGRGGDWKVNGWDGGSGGGAGNNVCNGGNPLPPVTVATRQDATLKQGNKGGDSIGDAYRGAGGGGAGGPGENGSSNSSPGPAGGAGLSSTIQDGKTVKWYAGGGGGGGSGIGGNPGGPGGSGLGGNGSGPEVAATDGKPNTGSGGGAGGGKGGSGIVIVRFVRTGM